MKTLIIYSVLILCSGMVSAQEIIELKETRVEYSPISTPLIRTGNSFTFSITESFIGEFEKDPLVFMKNYFDINTILREVEDKKMSTIEVTLRSRKGYIWAGYDKNGTLLGTAQRFKNIMLPMALCHQLYKEHKGWNMVKNVHVARGRGENIDKEFYRIKMENGNKRKTVKVNRTGEEQFELATL